MRLCTGSFIMRVVLMENAMTILQHAMVRFAASLAMLVAMSTYALAARADEALWSQLQQGGHIILMRHAVTIPGIGDPSNFMLGDCSTQRNLSEQGRDDARRIGRMFREKSIPVADVWTSRWCRCIDTALLAFENAKTMSILDSIFNDDAKRAAEKTAEAMRVITRTGLKGNLVLVTHQQNIQALVGESLSSGEMLVTRRDQSGRLKLLGRLQPPSR